MSNARTTPEYYLKKLSESSSLSTQYTARTTDAFGKRIADGTVNQLDVPSHYPYNPERWHIHVNSTRVFPEYDVVPQYNWAEDVHEMIPGAGETVVMETAELPRYVVQYEQVGSWAFQLNQPLQSGDRLRVGIFDEFNGWYFEQNDTHSELQCDLVIRRATAEAKRIPNLKLEIPFTTWCRFGLQFSWYNVGPAKLTQFYTKSNLPVLTDIGSISIDDGGRGPQKGNMPLRYEITAGATTTGLKLEAGSCALITLGNVQPRKRLKGTDFTETIGTTNTWKPLRAFRLQDRTRIVNVQLAYLDILDYSVDAEVRILAMVMPMDLLTFSTNGWSVPAEWGEINSAIESRTDVTGFPDVTGTVVATTNTPGGFQTGRSVLIPVSGQYQKGVRSGGGIGQKRAIPSQDVLVIFGKSPSIGDVTYEIQFEEDW